LDVAEPALRVSLEEFVASGDVWFVAAFHSSLARIASIRGDTATARTEADLIEGDPHLRDNASWPQFVAIAARVRAEAGDRDGAARLLVALQQADGGSAYRGFEIRDAVVAALAIGDLDLARRIVEGSADPRPLAAENRRLARALVAEGEENLESAAEAFQAAAEPLEALSLPEHTHALLGYGRVLIKLGRPAQAEATLRQVRDLARRMGAAPWLAEADGLLAAIAGQTSKTEAPAGSESARMP
jgi:tetratricopeptide (TPR) repeat protein